MFLLVGRYHENRIQLPIFNFSKMAGKRAERVQANSPIWHDQANRTPVFWQLCCCYMHACSDYSVVYVQGEAQTAAQNVPSNDQTGFSKAHIHSNEICAGDVLLQLLCTSGSCWCHSFELVVSTQTFVLSPCYNVLLSSALLLSLSHPPHPPHSIPSLCHCTQFLSSSQWWTMFSWRCASRWQSSVNIIEHIEIYHIEIYQILYIIYHISDIIYHISYITYHISFTSHILISSLISYLMSSDWK